MQRLNINQIKKSLKLIQDINLDGLTKAWLL